MKKIIRLTESDLVKIVKRVIKEHNEKTLQDLIEDAKEILEHDFEFSVDAINEMDEFDIINVLRDYGYDELVNEIENAMEEEGFYNVDMDEPYDAIGGYSVNDLKNAFEKVTNKMKKDRK